MKKAPINTKVPTPLIITAKVLSFFSDEAAVKFAARLFTTPIRHKLPKRELHMEENSKVEFIDVHDIGKNIATYHYGESDRKILLVHGWSGRGTQLFKIADALLSAGYSTVSFDAPAHGKSDGKTTLMPEFVSCIFEIDKKYGPFEVAVGHSLGGMSLLNAVKRGFKIQRLVTIGSGDVVEDIMSDFINKLKLNTKYTSLMRQHFERNTDESMDNYSAYHAAAQVDIPVLVIHDEGDIEVPVTSAENIHKHLKNGQLMITQNLGHRKILGNEKVIDKTIEFITNDTNEITNTASAYLHDNIL
ncbi:MAG: alpha/beta hydrolase [Flavobacterium sp.]|nr:alpha/beta hydrolase [Flavobacterium sp.]